MRPIISGIILVSIFIYTQVQARDWYKISASHAEVEYQEGLENIADSLLRIAETALPRICKMSGLSPNDLLKEKAHIILTDAVDVANGFALGNTVVIYALSSAYLTNLTGTRNWYEEVLTHELVHLVTFRKLRRKANLFGSVSYLYTPRWFWEGIAQYFSESWNAYRGDLYIKNALLYGQLTPGSLSTLDDGRLLYATGHSFIRYLADQYGDSSLIRLLSHNADGFIYNFDHAFKHVYQMSVKQMFPHFMRHLILHYGDKWSEFSEKQNFAKMPTIGYRMQQIIPLIEADSTFLISSQLNQNHLYNTLLIVKFQQSKPKILNELTNHYHTPIVVNQKQNLIAFGRFHYGISDNLSTQSYDWFVHDRTNKKTWKLISDIHARYATFSPEDDLLLVEVKPDQSCIHKIDINTGNKKIIFKTRMPLGKIKSFANKSLLLTGQRNNGNRDLFLFTGNTLHALTDDIQDDFNPVIICDTLFLFNRYENKTPLLAVYNLNNKKFTALLHDQFEYWVHEYNLKTKSVIANTWEPGRKTVFKSIPLDSLTKEEIVPIKFQGKKTYSSWMEKVPLNEVLSLPDTTIDTSSKIRVMSPQFPLQHGLSVAFPGYDLDYGMGIYGLTSWFEMLQRQAIIGTFLFFPENMDRSLFLYMHLIEMFDLTFMPIFYHGPVIFAHDQSNRIEMLRDIAAINVGKQIYISGNSRWFALPSLSVSWDHFKLLETVPNLDQKYYYNRIRIGGTINYALPNRLYPLLPKKELGIYAYLNQSISKEYDFRVYETGLHAAHNILIENLGLQTEASFLKQSGNLPPLQTTGIDRFYGADVPRDFGYTRSVRGVREDIGGNQLLWSSSELVLYLARNTPLNLLFIPIKHLSVSGFFDYANISATDDTEIYGYGVEMAFGTSFLRFGGGYAIGKLTDGKKSEEFYLRFSVPLTVPKWKNSNRSLWME